MCVCGSGHYRCAGGRPVQSLLRMYTRVNAGRGTGVRQRVSIRRGKGLIGYTHRTVYSVITRAVIFFFLIFNTLFSVYRFLLLFFFLITGCDPDGKLKTGTVTMMTTNARRFQILLPPPPNVYLPREYPRIIYTSLGTQRYYIIHYASVSSDRHHRHHP